MKLTLTLLILASFTVAPSFQCLNWFKPQVPYEPACTWDPCLNGGTCLERGDGSYECLCADGYVGYSCETHLNMNCTGNMFFNYCASACGPARCGVEIQVCTAQCVEKCDCPHGTSLCPEGQSPVGTCVTNCDTDCS